MNDNCPYSDECGILSNCDETCCRVKELFDDFYTVEKLYTDAKQENEELKILIESNRQQVEHSEMLIYDNDYLQQKLEKINKIAKENCSCTRCEDFNCCDGCQDENYRRILQIIEGKENNADIQP